MGKRGRKPIDLIGKKFGRLTVIEDTGKRKHNQIMWLCKCECGNEVEVRGQYLKNNSTKSCGCLKDEGPKIFAGIFYENTNVSRLNENIPKNNTSGVKGVTWDRNSKKWLSQIQLKNKNIHLGRYEKLEDAAKARKEAEDKYFKPILEKYGKEE